VWRQWSEDVTLFLHAAPDPTDEQWGSLLPRGVRVVRGDVAAVCGFERVLASGKPEWAMPRLRWETQRAQDLAAG
jgi:hypothetical protein